MTETVLSETPAEGVRQITMNRPDRRNALDRATYQGLIDALVAADADASIRAVVLTGAGGCFTSGNDLKDFAAAAATGVGAEIAIDFLTAISTADRPVGFKAAGGIRTTTEAWAYLEMADRIMGEGWASPQTFRFGASGLLDSLIATLNGAAPVTAQEGY